MTQSKNLRKRISAKIIVYEFLKYTEFCSGIIIFIICALPKHKACRQLDDCTRLFKNHSNEVWKILSLFSLSVNKNNNFWTLLHFKSLIRAITLNVILFLIRKLLYTFVRLLILFRQTFSGF